MKLKEILELSFYLILGSGVGSFITQKLFEHRLNKKLSRFNELYSNKLEIIRHLYSLLVKAEKSMNIILGCNAPFNDSERDELKRNIKITEDFIDYFEENEIVLDDSVIKIMLHIKERLKEANEISIFANLLDDQDQYEAAEDRKSELRQILSEIEFPSLKEQLKREFQKKFKLLES